MTEFRKKVRQSDGIIFACPEYNFAVSAPLKNAIDWGSRSHPDGTNVFSNKWSLLVGSGGGFGTQNAQQNMR